MFISIAEWQQLKLKSYKWLNLNFNIITLSVLGENKYRNQQKHLGNLRSNKQIITAFFISLRQRMRNFGLFGSFVYISFFYVLWPRYIWESHISEMSTVQGPLNSCQFLKFFHIFIKCIHICHCSGISNLM